jgi:hypothetical protein
MPKWQTNTVNRRQWRLVAKDTATGHAEPWHGTLKRG